VSDKHSSAVVYLYTLAGKVYAVAFHGKAQKPDWRFSFRNEEKRAARISEHFANIAGWEKRTADAKAARTGYKHGLKVGDMLHYSWGYDQTNCDFFQVIARTECTVTIQEIGGRDAGNEGGSSMSTNLRPKKDAFLDGSKPMVKHVAPGDQVRMDFGNASICGETQKFYSSWYA